jgi:hypothetical protein
MTYRWALRPDACMYSVPLQWPVLADGEMMLEIENSYQMIP